LSIFFYFLYLYDEKYVDLHVHSTTKVVEHAAIAITTSVAFELINPVKRMILHTQMNEQVHYDNHVYFSKAKLKRQVQNKL